MTPHRRIKHLLLLAAAPVGLAFAPLAVAAADRPPTRSLTVIMTDYRFKPSRLTFQHGVAYRLHVENRGTELHEFHAARFFASATIDNPAVLNANKTEIVVPPGVTADLYFVAPPPGRYRLYCSDHDWAGMVGEIRVK